MIKNIQVVNKDISKKEFEERFMITENPVLIKEGCKSWAASKKWNMDFFIEHGQAVDVRVSSYKNRGDESAFVKKIMNLAQVMEGYKKYEKGEYPEFNDIYIAGWHYMHDLPNLFEDLEIPELFQDNIIEDISKHVFEYDWSSIFIGHKDTETPCHTDSFYVGVWIALIKGVKKIRYVSTKENQNMANGMDLFDPAVVKSLEEKGVEVIDALVEEGDIVFHPSGWWHQVKNLEFNIAVSNNYVNKINYLAFEQQLIAKTVLPMLTGITKVQNLIDYNDFTDNANYSEQSIATSNYLANQEKINQFLSNYVEKYETILSILQPEVV